jgi:hypothetical protein
MPILNFNVGWDYKGKKGTYMIWHEAFKRQMSDWMKAWRRLISEVLMPFVVRQFGSQGGEGRRQWAELAPTTLRRRLYPGKPILQQTGMLQMSFIGGPDHVEEIEPKRMKWGSQSPYALFHQTGTGIKLGDPTPRGYEFKESLRGGVVTKRLRYGAVHAGGHWEPTEKGRGMPQRPILDLYWLKVAELGKEYSPWNERMMDIVTWELREAARRAGFALMTAEERAMPGAGRRALEIGDIAMGNV